MALVRPATPADHPAISRLFLELRVDDPVPEPDRFARDMMATTLVAEEAGQVLGYGFFQVLRTTTYVRNLVTAPEARRRGLGRELLAAIAERARAAGCSTWSLNVKPENVAAVRLYESVGLRVIFHAKALRLPWAAIEGAAPREVRTVPPEDDAVLEQLAEEEEGILAGQRARRRLALGIVDAAGAWTGLAIVNPDLPGALPLFVIHVEDALPFVAGLRPFTRPDSDHLTIAIHRREDVVGALLDAGAELRMAIDQMKGPLP